MKKALLVLLATAAAGFAGYALGQSESSDAAFVKEAASVSLMEVELGQAAASQAEDPKVRAYGQMLASDHGRTHEKLRAAAATAGIQVPTSMQPTEQQKFDELSRLEGHEFDQAYVDAMLKGHKESVEKFRQQAQEGKTEIDRWAAETLPLLESHLAQGRALVPAVAASTPAQRASGSEDAAVEADVAAPPPEDQP